jgi:hypothetical protein
MMDQLRFDSRASVFSLRQQASQAWTYMHLLDDPGDGFAIGF